MQRVIDFLNNLPVVKDFEPEFMRGVVCGIMFLAIILLLLQILLLLWRFRTRFKRVDELVIRQSNGNLSIASKALEGSIVDLVRGLTELQVDQARLYQKKKQYTVRIYCSYNGSELNFSGSADLIKQKVFSMFNDTLGVHDVGKVEISLSTLKLQADRNPVATLEQEIVVEPYRSEPTPPEPTDESK